MPESARSSLFADSLEPLKRRHRDEIFFLRFEGRPDETNPESEEVAGGFIHAWIDADTLRDAELLALKAISQDEWIACRLDDWALADRDQCPEEALESYMEARSKGLSLSIYAWGHDS